MYKTTFDSKKNKLTACKNAIYNLNAAAAYLSRARSAEISFAPNETVEVDSYDRLIKEISKTAKKLEKEIQDAKQYC
jgi:hypothetical protein